MPQTQVPARRHANGDTIRFTPTTESVGDIKIIGTMALPVETIDPYLAYGQLSPTGLWSVPKDSSQFALGDAVYWNATGNPNDGTAGTGAATSTASGNTLMGSCMLAASSSDGFVLVYLTSAQRTATVAGAVTADSITASGSIFPIAGSNAAQGGSVSITGGTSSASGNAGGAVTVTGGTPGATGIGGAVTITSGAGGSSSGAAGAVNISVGSATNANGASVTITAGNGAGGTNGGGHVNLVPGTAVSTGIPGEVRVNGDANLITVVESLSATDASRAIYVANRPMILKSVRAFFSTPSSSGTLTVEKLTGTTAAGSGTALLTGTISLAGSANTVVSGTLISTVASLTFAAGDRLGVVIAGTMTNLANCKIVCGFAPQ